MQCTICLSDEGDVVQKGCYCRGDAGAVHLDCLIELCSYRSTRPDVEQPWQKCETCNAVFSGRTGTKIAASWFDKVSARDPDDRTRIDALFCLSCHIEDEVLANRYTAEVLAARTRTLGPEHIDTLWAAKTLAISHRLLGKFPEAIELCSQTVDTMKRVLGAGDLATLSTCNDLACIYRLAGRIDEALAIQKEVVDETTKVLGPENYQTLSALCELADILREKGDLGPAMAQVEALLATRRRVQGCQHPETIATANSLSIIYMKLERYEEARALAKELMEQSVVVKGETHVDNTTIQANLGLFTLLAGRAEEAEPIQRDAVEKAELSRGYDPTILLFIKASHGLALARLGRYDEAVPLLRATHARQHANESVGPEHTSTLRTASFLGEALVAQGKVGEGRALLVETLATQTRVLEADVYETRETAKRLAKCP